MIKAIIFDMDGVIVDSEYTYLESKTQMLNDFGYAKNISYQYQFMGTTYEYMWSTMKKELSLPKDVTYYINEMNIRRNEMIAKDGVKPIDGVINLINQLIEKGITLAVASSSPRREIERNLQELNIYDAFKVIVSGEEVENSKPAPDTYLKALELLGIDSNNSLAIEDTKNGSLSAYNAGLYCVGFNNLDYPIQDLDAANKVVTSFEKINIDTLLQK